MFGIGMLLLLPGPVPIHLSADSTQWTASQRAVVESGRTYDGDERERTETWNQVDLFVLKSRSFELIRSQMTHHQSLPGQCVHELVSTWSVCSLTGLYLLSVFSNQSDLVSVFSN